MKLVRGFSYSCKSWFGLEDFGGTNIDVTGLPASTILLQIVQEIDFGCTICGMTEIITRKLTNALKIVMYVSD